MEECRCIQIQSAEELNLSREIRKKVFVEEQEIPAELEFDELDPSSLHVLCFKEDLPIATGRLVLLGESKGQLSRISVLPGYRRRGCGQKVVKALEELARAEGLRHLSLYPHSFLEEFYSNLGYKTVPGVKESVAGHALIYMEKWL